MVVTTKKTRDFGTLLACLTLTVGLGATAEGAGLGLTPNDLNLTGETARLARAGQEPSTTVATPRRKGSPVHARILKDYAAAPEHPVILFGDSLTDNWRRERFAAMKDEFAAVNAGICGDRISDLLWRIEDMLPALAAKPPRVATFMIGTNDIGTKAGAEDIAAGMEHLVRVFGAACPETKIVIFAIPPRGVSHDLRVLPFVEPINRLYRKLADDRRVFFFDFSSLLTDRHGTVVLTDLYEGDRLHFSDKGYAEVVTPFVSGAIRLVGSPTTPADYLHRISLWRDYLELRRDTARKNHALEELWKNEWFLYELPRTLLQEFAALKADPAHIPQMPAEYLRQEREEGLPSEGFRPLVVGVSDQHLDADHNIVENCYVESLVAAGHIPVVVPCMTNDVALKTIVDRLDVLILTGGADVSPARYETPRSPNCGTPDLLRDDFDFRLLAAARARRLPVVGVCRGCQLVNVGFGGTLWQDLPSEFTNRTADVSHGAGEYLHPERHPAAHQVRIVPGTRLAAVLGTENLAVNSHHHQAVKRIAPGFRVTALAPDGVIEGIESTDYPAACVQFHPEALVARADKNPAYDHARLVKFFTALEMLFERNAQ